MDPIAAGKVFYLREAGSRNLNWLPRAVGVGGVGRQDLFLVKRYIISTLMLK